MPALAVCGVDIINTGHPCTSTALIQGSLQSKVTVGGNAVAVVGDAIQIHTTLVGGDCVPHSAVINSGSSKVFIAGIPVARVGDSADQGVVATGSASINVGA